MTMNDRKDGQLALLAMNTPPIVSSQEWEAAREQLLVKEKAHMRAHDALAAEFDTEQLTDLILTIGFYCAVVRVLASLAIDVEPDYQPYLDRFPLKGT